MISRASSESEMSATWYGAKFWVGDGWNYHTAIPRCRNAYQCCIPASRAARPRRTTLPKREKRSGDTKW